MKKAIVAMLVLGGFMLLSTIVDASAYVCARGVYRAGCVGPRGAIVVRHPYHPYVRHPYGRVNR
jgi:hypothetical protein